ncbi:hypothetical protein LCGC14_0724320 [marine sediment metagenome]|uniref:Methyltransferase domain-containing protein n=1 Tax=marine sediment metagenome TaxID=412755 RepID=A0A0F9QBI6_9ZZZZ
MKQHEIEAQARKANSPDLWNTLWGKAETADWRREALSQVYTRIERAMPDEATFIIDIGGGQGDLAKLLVQEHRWVEVWDHSQVALDKAEEAGIPGTLLINLEDAWQRNDAFNRSPGSDDDKPVIVCTEVLEHLSAEARADILRRSAATAGKLGAFFSVPNARLAPEEEHQHTIEFTAVTFRHELEAAFGVGCVRVAALGPFLLGLCGEPLRKPFTLSMCLPVRDEEAELEKVLASFREVADEIVVGIDPRTKDGSREIAERYADIVFDLVDPAAQEFFHLRDEDAYALEDAVGGVDYDEVAANAIDYTDYEQRGLMRDDPRIPPEGVHFAWVRNQCMRRCTSDWIFMTEGHERLTHGHNYLLQLHRVLLKDGGQPEVISVARQGRRQRWAFPWLCKNDPDRIHYVRSTHNTLSFGDAVMVAIPGIMTLHERDHDNALARAEQRQAQNKEALLDDWEKMGNSQSLFYLGQEERGDDPEKAAEHLELYLEQNDGNGMTRYQARLMIAKIHCRRFRQLRKKATEPWRHGCIHDDLQPDCQSCQDLHYGIPRLRDEMLAEADELEEKTRGILMDATSDDWTRTEHWVWLGDLAFGNDQLEEALMFYRYAATLVGEPPFGPWWIDLDLYGYLPAQRMAMVCGHLGRGLDAVHWARKVVDTLPEDSPAWCFEEARGNLKQFEEACRELGLIDGFVVQQLEAEPVEQGADA